MTIKADLVDLIILALLIGVFIYGYVMARRIERLRLVLGELSPALQAYVRAVDRSQDVARQMSRSADTLKRDECATSVPAQMRVKQGPDLTKKAMISTFYNQGATSGK